mgnify:CR=1 FL=1
MNNKEFSLDVSIIIVNYNTKQLLADCLNSIYEQTKDISFEVIVSDNGSNDGSIEMIKADFPTVILIENNKNLGFGAANNRGLAIAKGKYIFYLNSDTILLNNAVKIFFDYWEENREKENIGALGTNLIDADGNYSWSYGSIYGEFSSTNELLKDRTKLLIGSYKAAIRHYVFRRKLREVHKKKNVSYYTGIVGYISGADLFLLNNNYARFDENIFLYYEETDLEYQLTRAGFVCRIIDGPKIIHLEGGSEKKNALEVVDLASFSKINLFKSCIYFFKKNKIATPLQVFRLKIITLLIWLNPLIIRKTKSYIRPMLKI